jgi:hypothetical protein
VVQVELLVLAEMAAIPETVLLALVPAVGRVPVRQDLQDLQEDLDKQAGMARPARLSTTERRNN